MNGRIVNIDTGWQSVSAVSDLLEAKLAATQAGFLLEAKILQSSEEAAAEAETLQVTIKRASGAYTSGTGGAPATVIKGSTGDPAHGMTTANRNNPTQATGGTIEAIEPGAFNVLSGEWNFKADPIYAPPIGPSQGVILSLDEPPADAVTIRAQLKILITHG